MNQRRLELQAEVARLGLNCSYQLLDILARCAADMGRAKHIERLLWSERVARFSTLENTGWHGEVYVALFGRLG